MANPAETVYLSFRDWELSNNLRLVQFRRRKVAVHTFGCPQHSDHVHSLRNDMLHFRILLFFSLTSYPAEIAYFNSPNQELSNGARVMELYWKRNLDPSRSPCLKTVHRKSERGNFLVLRLVLLKNAYFNSANGRISKDIRPVELRKRKIVNPYRGASLSSVERNFSKFSGKKLKSRNFLSFGQSCWNWIFKLPRWRAF